MCKAPPSKAPLFPNQSTPGASIGHPIIPALGAKFRDEVDYQDVGPDPLRVERQYLSTAGWSFNNRISLSFAPAPLPPANGQSPCSWPTSGPPCIFNGEPTPLATVGINLGDGSRHDFMAINPPVWTALGDTGTLQQTATGFVYLTVDKSRYDFDLNGLLQKVTDPSGLTKTYGHDSAGRVSQVTNHFGRTMSLGYSAENRLVQVTTPDNQIITYTYDGANNLTQVSYPDSATRTFHYENTTYPNALTGISMNGARIMTFAYDAQGRATNTQMVGGVDSYQVDYSGAIGDPVTVTDPLGTQRNYSYSTKYGQIGVTSSSAPVGYGENDAYYRSQNGLGLIESEMNFNYTTTMFTWDLARRLPTSVKRAAAQTVEATTSTQWHPTQPVPAKVAEPGVLTTNIYNGQPDPFNSNAVASCAPASAVLPDGSPIAVLCKRVEQATTDANGSAGLTPSLQSSVPARTWRWTYNADAQVLTETNPLNHTSTYTYYASTGTGHTRGDLQTSANALGHTTQYTQYNGAGNLLQSSDPNGVITTYTYDTRQRLTSVNVGGSNTSYTYTPAGLLNVVTLPNSSTVTYSYDAAQRLTGIADSLGNSISYTLDNAGNRTAEQFKDQSGTLSRQLNRVFDALGRQQQVSGLQ